MEGMMRPLLEQPKKACIYIIVNVMWIYRRNENNCVKNVQSWLTTVMTTASNLHTSWAKNNIFLDTVTYALCNMINIKLVAKFPP